MAIGTIIHQRRKSLGLTQEQVAEMLGVTAPAVNKWEKSINCPDISLLAPLARLLKTDVNTLLEFDRDISQPELILICREISLKAQNTGYQAAFESAEEKLREYPNCDALFHNLAVQLQTLLVSADLDETENSFYLEKINNWYRMLSESEDAVIRNSALYMLASYEISVQHYDTAQEYLNRMPDRKDTPDKRMLQAGIYLKQDRSEEAAGLMQAALLATVSDLQMILFKLLDAELALGDKEAANYVAERAKKASEIFDLSEYNSFVACYQIAVHEKNAADSTEYLRRMLQAQKKGWMLNSSPLFKSLKLSQSSASMAQMIVPMLKSMQQSEEFSFLHEYEGFKNLLEEYNVN